MEGEYPFEVLWRRIFVKIHFFYPTKKCHFCNVKSQNTMPLPIITYVILKYNSKYTFHFTYVILKYSSNHTYHSTYVILKYSSSFITQSYYACYKEQLWHLKKSRLKPTMGFWHFWANSYYLNNFYFLKIFSEDKYL